MGKKLKKETKTEKIDELATEEQALQEDIVTGVVNEKVEPVTESVVESVDEEQLETEETHVSERQKKKTAKKLKRDLEMAIEIEKEDAARAKKKAKKDARKAKKKAKKESKINQKNVVFEASTEQPVVVAESKKEKSKASKKQAKMYKSRANWVKKFFKKHQGKEEERMFQFIENDDALVLKRAYMMLDVTAEEIDKTFIIKMPDSFDKKRRVHYRLSIAKDGKKTLLYDQAYLNILCFGENSLYNYSANVDYTTGLIGLDGTHTFNYFDIVSIETKLTYDSVENPKYSQFYIVLHLSNGNNSTINLRNHRLNPTYQLPELLTAQEERIVKLLKEKITK